MAKLYGAQKMVLQAILDLPKGTGDTVTDTQIAEATQLALDDVRNWLETLDTDGYADVVRTTAGFSASITANGKLAVGQYRPFSPQMPGTDPRQQKSVPSTPTNVSSSSSIVNKAQADAGSVVPRHPIHLFYSYSHKDEVLRDELEEALALLKRQGLVSGWHDRRIGVGEEWKGAIDKNLEEAKVILLLVSSAFMASNYCWDIETKRALERHDHGEAKVIPIILRPCDWQGAPFGKLQGLPKDTKPVTSWANKDEAWTDVAKGLRQAVEAMMGNAQ